MPNIAEAPSAPQPLTVLSEEERMFQDAVRRFARERIAPHVRDMDEAGVFRKDLLHEMFELGLMGIEIPEELGGQGGDFFQAVLAVEALAKVDPSAAVIVDVQNTIANNVIIRWGNDDQKRRYLPKLATEIVASFALSEAGSGSDAFALATRAEKRGDHYAITGRKLWITNAAEAGLFLLFANANPARRLSRHHVLPGRARLPGIPGRQEGRQARHPRVVHLRADPGRLPGARRQRARRSRQRLQDRHRNLERRPHRDRRADGRAWRKARSITPSPMRNSASNSASRSPIFKACSSLWPRWQREVEAARLLVYNAARLRDAGLPFVTEAAMAKYFASQVAEDTASRAVEIFGGVGFTKDYPVEKLYRDAKIGRIYEGTTNIQKLTIAKQILA